MSTPAEEEEKRLQAVRDLGLLDRPEEERFRRIARLARQHFRAGSCAITLVDEDRAFYVSLVGADKTDNSIRSDTLCGRVVAGKEPVVVSDSSKEASSQLYKELIERLDLNFYAGVPILNPEGYAVGALCIMDHIPRRFTRRELEALADFAAIVEDEMMIRRASATRWELIGQLEKLRIKAFVDPLTNVWNRGAIFDILNREIERALRSKHCISCCMMDLDRFKRINDTYGHQAGDEVLVETCERTRNCVRPYDALGRYGGEEFLLIFPETSLEQATAQAERIRQAIGGRPFVFGQGDSETITISIGVAEFRHQEDVNEFLGRADQALYKAKHLGRDRVEGAPPE